ncbi:two component regulator with propeller domain [Roseimicrobium gellanilyticum]|uniref:histidine kinase n=1 Tax=Roseimicrobium gellanilyticum TaxID=748857 RepID=A0A366H7A4_9BACT|nr:two-component regulator propeller domain-containing protein [Roseimicrobium gellanilyticum]RBP38051.1 two component regulator with propeller domain [Roseimicrobium gellanilyticum]
MRRLASLLREMALLQACAAAVLVSVSAHAYAQESPPAPPPPVPPPPSEWVARNWQTDDGLPQNTINALLQTHDGFLWVGTNGGLARFDGLHFRNFGLQDGLRAVLVTSLGETTQGELWVGTSGGGVSRWERGRFVTYGESEGFPENSDVMCMVPDRDGSLWLGTTVGLVHWAGGKFTKMGGSHGLPEKQVRALTLDAEGVLWVSVIMEGVYQGKGGKFIRESEPGPVTGDCYSLMTHRDGSVWAGAGNGRLWKRQDGKWRELGPAAGLPKSSFVGLAEGMDGALWTTVIGSGLYRSDGERFAKVEWGEKQTRVLRAIVTDSSGSIWLGTAANGLIRLSPRLLHYWGSGDEGKPLSVTTIAEDKDGVWWAGTGNSWVHRFEAGEFREVTDPSVKRVSPNFYCGVTGSDGSIWMAGEQFLHRFAAGQAMQSFLEPPIRGEAIRAMCVDGDAIWLGTYYSTLLKYSEGKVETVAPAGSFSGGITSLVLERPGVLWIGSSGGLHRWENGNTRVWGTKDGLLTQSVRALYREANGTLWIGTLGGGLARMKDGRITNYTTREGLIDDIISQIIADDSGNLWLGCNHGIMRIDRGEFDELSRGEIAQLHPMVFGRNEGMVKEQCTGGHSPTVIRTRNGRLLFPMAAGVVEIDPQQLQRGAMTAPKADIESILVNGHEVASGKRVSIPPGPHHLEVKFTAPALAGGERVRFRHRVEGLDTSWAAGSSRRRVSYDGLPPGRYTFRVVASDDRGNWSEQGASFAFVVRPFFWQTIWFRAGAMLLLVGAGGFAAWWHARAKHRHQLADLERARQQHAELAHASRVSLLGELSASLAHELKQPLTTILSNAQAALRFLNHPVPDVEEVRSSLNDIADADRRANEIIERMRAMIKKGQSEMELRDINADIHHSLLLIHSDLVGRNVTVSTSLSPELSMVSADHIQLQQVLINLIINGCDAMSDAPPEMRQLFIETKREGMDMIRVSVADRGTGITPEMLEQIFKPFYSTKQHGLGMGLSICQAIIRAHGGRLWAESGPDGGAVFHFTLRMNSMAATKDAVQGASGDAGKSRG